MGKETICLAIITIHTGERKQNHSSTLDICFPLKHLFLYKNKKDNYNNIKNPNSSKKIAIALIPKAKNNLFFLSFCCLQHLNLFWNEKIENILMSKEQVTPFPCPSICQILWEHCSSQGMQQADSRGVNLTAICALSVPHPWILVVLSAQCYQS